MFGSLVRRATSGHSTLGHRRCISTDTRKTKNGVTWDWITKAGRENPSCRGYLGVYAGDPESYSLFWNQFKPYIVSAHMIKEPLLSKRKWQPGHIMSPPQNIDIPDVVSTRIRVARNLINIPFPSCMASHHRFQVRELVQKSLRELPGTFYLLSELTTQIRETLNLNQVPIFEDNDPLFRSAGMYSDWPVDRGIWVSSDYRVVVWVNERDHIRIISTFPKYALEVTADRVDEVLDVLDDNIGFARWNKLGYLASSPTNVGTGLRCSACVRLSSDDPTIEQLVSLGMKVTPHPSSSSQVIIEPAVRLGRTEKEMMAQLQEILLIVFGNNADIPTLSSNSTYLG